MIEEASRSLRAEADALLHARGLLALLARHGRAEVTGSCALDLMTWRDLDIYVVAEGWTTARFFELGRDLERAFSPLAMTFRNEQRMRTPGLPEGLYWGVRLDAGDGEEWKVDLWGISPAQHGAFKDYVPSLLRRMTPELRQVILAIKSECCRRPGYGKELRSTDIYAAVLDHGVRTTAALDALLATRH